MSSYEDLAAQASGFQIPQHAEFQRGMKVNLRLFDEQQLRTAEFTV